MIVLVRDAKNRLHNFHFPDHVALQGADGLWYTRSLVPSDKSRRKQLAMSLTKEAKEAYAID